MATIESFDPIEVYFTLSEGDLLKPPQARRRRGAPAAARTASRRWRWASAARPAIPHRGTLDFTESGVDPATGTLRTPGHLPEPRPRDPARPLRPGPDPGRHAEAAAARPRARPGDRPARGLRPYRQGHRPEGRARGRETGPPGRVPLGDARPIGRGDAAWWSRGSKAPSRSSSTASSGPARAPRSTRSPPPRPRKPPPPRPTPTPRPRARRHRRRGRGPRQD